MTREGGLDWLVDVLLGYVDPISAELVSEPVATIEDWFQPLKTKSLLDSAWSSDKCSCDGYYDTHIDPERPWIIFDGAVTPRRRAHTLLHELGHHLCQTECSEVLEGLDDLAGDDGDPQEWEERVCHRFASRLLVPDSLLDTVVGTNPINPSMVRDLVEQGAASWESSAVRLAEKLTSQAWIVLLRSPGVVGFCAHSGLSGSAGWYRGSKLDPSGALAKSFAMDQTAQKDVYRFDQSYAIACFADTLRISDRLVVAVLSVLPSVKRLDTMFGLEEPDPLWKTRETICERCGEEFRKGWCETCTRRKCLECGGCGCSVAASERLCEGCWIQRPAELFSDQGLCREVCDPI